jgi:hypothetical protein
MTSRNLTFKDQSSWSLKNRPDTGRFFCEDSQSIIRIAEKMHRKKFQPLEVFC